MPALPDPTQGLPPFTSDPVDRLVHTLAAYEPAINKNADDFVIIATSASGGQRTGLTWGDLVALKELLGR